MKQPAETARDNARDIPSVLNADALTLPAYCFPKIVQLVFHYVADCFARGIDVLTHLIHRLVDWDAVDQIAAALDSGAEAPFGARRCPACAFHRAVTSPARSF
jgi:hypothetical protein